MQQQRKGARAARAHGVPKRTFACVSAKRAAAAALVPRARHALARQAALVLARAAKLAAQRGTAAKGARRHQRRGANASHRCSCAIHNCNLKLVSLFLVAFGVFERAFDVLCVCEGSRSTRRGGVWICERRHVVIHRLFLSN